ncbi:MAG: hypothetical protein OXE82_06780 [Rhodobacter sp.]|nr:hypothetical protein [Rhodobacter sp.]
MAKKMDLLAQAMRRVYEERMAGKKAEARKTLAASALSKKPKSGGYKISGPTRSAGPRSRSDSDT